MGDLLSPFLVRVDRLYSYCSSVLSDYCKRPRVSKKQVSAGTLAAPARCRRCKVVRRRRRLFSRCSESLLGSPHLMSRPAAVRHSHQDVSCDWDPPLFWLPCSVPVSGTNSNGDGGPRWQAKRRGAVSGWSHTSVHRDCFSLIRPFAPSARPGWHLHARIPGRINSDRTHDQSYPSPLSASRPPQCHPASSAASMRAAAMAMASAHSCSLCFHACSTAHGPAADTSSVNCSLCCACSPVPIERGTRSSQWLWRWPGAPHIQHKYREARTLEAFPSFLFSKLLNRVWAIPGD